MAGLRERPPLDQLGEGRCPPPLHALIRQCWEHDPRRRPAAAEAAKELGVLEAQARGCGGGGSQNAKQSTRLHPNPSLRPYLMGGQLLHAPVADLADVADLAHLADVVAGLSTH